VYTVQYWCYQTSSWREYEVWGNPTDDWNEAVTLCQQVAAQSGRSCQVVDQFGQPLYRA
jgi:hypothetical protein